VTNLEAYLIFLRKRTARFTVKALLDSNEVVLEPDAACILDGSIKVIKNILDGTKRFVRFYRWAHNQTVENIPHLSNYSFIDISFRWNILLFFSI
jgi:hypothetical protein